MRGLNLGLGFSGAAGGPKWFQNPAKYADGSPGTLHLDFENDRYMVNGASVSFSDLFTFTRAGSATYKTGTGLATAASGERRLEVHPLSASGKRFLIEPSATNNFQRSQEFDNSYWNKYQLTVTPNVVLAPDGTLTADQCYASWVNDQHTLSKSTGTAVVGAKRTASIMAQKGTASWLRIEINNSSSFAFAFFDLDSGAIGTVGNGSTLGTTAAYIEDVGGGWYRCSVGVVPTVTNSLDVRYCVQSADNQFSWNASGQYISLWGAQFENNEITSYIPTTSFAVTRPADACVNNSSNVIPFSVWYNQAAGTFYAEYDKVLSIPTPIWSHTLVASNGTNNERFQIAAYSNNEASQPIFAGGSQQYNPSPQYPANQRQNIKAMIGAEANNARACVNGTLLGIDNSVVMPIADRFIIGSRADGSPNEVLNGHIKEIIYFPFHATDSEKLRFTT